MTAIAAFLRKTPVTRLHDYFTAAGFTSLPPVDWTKPESEVVEPLIMAVDDMDEDEKQRVVLDAGRVAALADGPGAEGLRAGLSITWCSRAGPVRRPAGRG